MRKYLLLSLFFILLLLNGCEGFFKPATDWHVSLKKEDKKPYGTYLAYQSLQNYFPGAAVTSLSHGFRYSNMTGGTYYNENGTSVLILVGLSFHLSDKEWSSLKTFARNGNEVVLFCSVLDSKIARDLGCVLERGNEEQGLSELYDGKENLQALDLRCYPGKQYGYQGHSLAGYFDTLTTSGKNAITYYRDDEDNNASDNDTETRGITPVPDTLGWMKGKANYLRYMVGNGHITIHAAPLVLSNYFLLQPGNRQYLDALWSRMPANTNKIYWHEYFKRRAEKSSISALWRYPATRLAIILALTGLLLYVLFEGKRRQRIIPVTEPLKNDSVSFVETVGRLYYNKGNHANIAEKMIQQFLEWARTKYLMNTSQLDEAFIQRLAIKSGAPERTVRSLLDMIFEVRTTSVTIDEAYLYHLYNRIQLFYKKQPA